MSAFFVGRSVELGLLGEQWQTALGGSPRFVVIEGDSGTGQSTLATHFASTLNPARVVRVTGDETETDLPLGLVDQLIDRLGPLTHGSTPPGSLPADPVTAPDPHPSAPDSSAPDSSAPDSSAPNAPGTGPRDAFRAGAILLDALLWAANLTPLLLIVDDAQLVDTASLAALTFAFRRLHSGRVLVLITIRPDGLVRLPPGLTRLVDAAGATIRLTGLSVADIREFAAVSGFGELSRPEARRLHEHTGGSPLHLRALLAELTLAQLGDERPGLPAPRTLTATIRGSLAARPAAAGRLAEAAGVLGPRSQFALAARLAEVPDPPAAAQDLAEIGLIHLVDGPSGRELVFTHQLLHAAVYDSTGAATRSRLHLRAAAATSGIESLRHRVAAAVLPDATLVAELISAAIAARDRGAWHAAARWYFDAVRVSEPGPDRDALLVSAVEMLLLDGDLPAVSQHQPALATLPTTPHRLLLQAHIAWLTGRAAEAGTLAETASAAAADTEPEIAVGAAALLVQLCVQAGDGRGAVAWSKIALAPGVLSPGMEQTTRMGLMSGLAMAGRIDEALGQAALLPAADVDGEFSLRHLAVGLHRLWADDAPGGLAELEASGAAPLDVRRGGVEPHRLIALIYLAFAHSRCGDWDVAVALAEQAVSLVEDTGQAWLSAFAASAPVAVQAARGQWVEAEESVAAARQAAAVLADVASRAFVDNAAVHLAACRGDARRVVAESQWLLGLERPDYHEPGFFDWSVHHAAALVELGEYPAAEQRLDRLTAYAHARGRQSRCAALTRVRAELAAARRDGNSARSLFEQAVVLSVAAEDPLEHAVLQLAFGRFLRRRGERRAAIERLRTADALFERLAATPFQQRCAAELAVAGASSGAPDDESPLSVLTPQEVIVAQLVAGGLTNREVAQRLSVSVKTIGYHLGHVYAKLGVKSRVELARKIGTPDAGGT